MDLLLSYIKENPELISALIGAGAGLIGTIVAYLALKTAYRRSLDLESEWRKTLFNAAGSASISMQQVMLLRTALRYDLVENPKFNTYPWLTNEMIKFCEHLNRKYNTNKNKNQNKLTFGEQEVIRIFIRCVLKHNWEMNENIFFDFFGKPKTKEYNFVAESYSKAAKIYSDNNFDEDSNFIFIDLNEFEVQNSSIEEEVIEMEKNSNCKLSKKNYWEFIKRSFLPVALIVLFALKLIGYVGMNNTNFFSGVLIVLLIYFFGVRK